MSVYDDFPRLPRVRLVHRDEPLSTIEAWSRPDMRLALANRDVAAMYRILQRHGVSQRRIAAATEQSQSEISEILAGRHVCSYDVLARIAEGLSIPRGRMGLAYDDDTAAMFDLRPVVPLVESDEPDLWIIYDSLSAER